ncbi:hypothetical protein SFRURICE_008953 [Spodoptera frugiperda]|uniref:SFRICE_008903 n=1 Tax=Spodoptera frugiperda TaxID=7108 RepID=A0A2H1WT83_SPOFR|nr:hypothetical protein SFRURICE_008953 [Spodoptera frugiperda]
MELGDSVYAAERIIRKRIRKVSFISLQNIAVTDSNLAKHACEITYQRRFDWMCLKMYFSLGYYYIPWYLEANAPVFGFDRAAVEVRMLPAVSFGQSASSNILADESTVVCCGDTN